VSWAARLSTRRTRAVLASAIALSALALVWTGYRAAVEWRHAAALVASRRAASAVDLLVSALSRDMRGAHTLVLLSAERDGLAGGSTADLLHPIAGAFARYPYAETFFSWHNTPNAPVVFFSRTERRPAWLVPAPTAALYPVVTGSNDRVGGALVERLGTDMQQGRRFSAFTTSVDGAEYQVVAIITYTTRIHDRADSAIGFLVNARWAREHYFAELASQMAAIESADRSVRFSIVDDAGRPVVGTPVAQDTDTAAARVFPVAFFDPAAVAVDPPPDLTLSWWTAVASTRDDPTLAAAERGAGRTLVVAAVMTVTLALGLIASLRAARASADLALMRADFVSAVTHELKTPLANIRAINDTLASGRTTPEMVREYAHMGTSEATRLTRLVDNLLAYSRVTDVADIYSFEPVALASVVQRSLQEFASALQRDRFEVTVDVPEDLPRVHADPTALGLMLNNLIDNAIRYSKDARAIAITARADSGNATLTVSDRGVGIPADELERVTRKFFRGRGSVAGGSGLGLAIVDRIVSDHRGRLAIRSTEGQGTTVSVTIPLHS
jgi:signal transduction histidine kinase